MPKFAKFLGIVIYFFVLITSFYHLFKFYEIFETTGESFVAFFVAIGFELSVLYFAYIYTKYRFTSAKYAIMLALFIVWFGNVFVMAQNVQTKIFAFTFLNIDSVKFILAIIASVFLPISSYFLGKITANLDMLKEKKLEEKNNQHAIVKEIVTETIVTKSEEPIILVAEKAPIIEAPFVGEIKTNIEVVNQHLQPEIVTSMQTAQEHIQSEVNNNIEVAQENTTVETVSIQTVQENIHPEISTNVETAHEITKSKVDTQVVAVDAEVGDIYMQRFIQNISLRNKILNLMGKDEQSPTV